MNLKHINRYFETENGVIVNFEQVNDAGDTPLFFALKYTGSKRIRLSEKEWEHLIEQSNLNQKDKFNQTPLMFVLWNNEKLNLEKFIHKILMKSDLKLCDSFGCSPLILALMAKEDKKINLSEDCWDYLINNSPMSKDEKYLNTFDMSFNNPYQTFIINQKFKLNNGLSMKNVNNLLKLSDINHMNQNQQTMLTTILEYGQNGIENILNFSKSHCKFIIKNTYKKNIEKIEKNKYINHKLKEIQSELLNEKLLKKINKIDNNVILKKIKI